MSWQKCVNAEPYSLAIPGALILALGGLHVWLGLSVLMLALPSEFVVLLWVLVFRSWQNVRSNARVAGSWLLSMDARNRFHIDEVVRNDGSRNRWKPGGRGPKHTGPCGTYDATQNLLSVGGIEPQDNGHTREHHYTCCRSVKMPGCIYIDLLDDYGKRLEILVFYRYHQREFYQRLQRYLALK